MSVPRCYVCGGPRDWRWLSCDRCSKKYCRKEDEAGEPNDDPTRNEDGLYNGRAENCNDPETRR